MLFGIVPLEAIGFVFSGNVVFATLIGGSGSLYGPVIGSFVFIWLSESVSAMWARWPLLLGVAFVVVVLPRRRGGGVGALVVVARGAPSARRCRGRCPSLGRSSSRRRSAR
jgi:branched-chain amino acid transport system permease protein